MNEQQLAAVKQGIEALRGLASDTGKFENEVPAITALQSIISQDALDKMAEDARTIGLRLDDWDKIGCVNHDCDQCRGVQEPVSEDRSRVLFERHWRKTRGPKKSDRELTRHRLQPQTYIQDSANRHWVTWQAALKTALPAAQKPWVGLTDEERSTIESEVLMRGENYPEVLAAIESKLKEKNK